MANDALQYVTQSTLSKNNFLINDFKIIPNPVNNSFYFDNSKLMLNEISIYTIQGKLIKNQILNQIKKNQLVDVSQLSKGIYFIFFGSK